MLRRLAARLSLLAPSRVEIFCSSLYACPMQVEDSVVAAWQELERRIVQEAWEVPVYFAPSTPALLAVYDDLYNPAAMVTCRGLLVKCFLSVAPACLLARFPACDACSWLVVGSERRPLRGHDPGRRRQQACPRGGAGDDSGDTPLSSMLSRVLLSCATPLLA